MSAFTDLLDNSYWGGGGRGTSFSLKILLFLASQIFQHTYIIEAFQTSNESEE
jgi:hypothetical protein